MILEHSHPNFLIQIELLHDIGGFLLENDNISTPSGRISPWTFPRILTPPLMENYSPKGY